MSDTKRLHDVTIVRRAPMSRLAAKLERVTKEPKGRRYYIVALAALADVLQARWQKEVAAPGGDKRLASALEELCPRLIELASALSDLDAGIVAPLFKPGDKPGDRVKGFTSGEWRRRAFVALGVRALVKSRVARKTAAKIAERAMSPSRALFAKGATAQSILSWYDDFRDGEIKNREAVYVFRRGCSQQDRGELSDPDFWFRAAALAA